MFDVVCPVCKEIRQVAARKSWMIGEAPYEKLCRKHAEGKGKSIEHRKKLSNSIKKIQTPEVIERKRQFMLDHPEIWQNNLKPELGPISRLGIHHTDETKEKIGLCVSLTKRSNKEKK